MPWTRPALPYIIDDLTNKQVHQLIDNEKGFPKPVTKMSGLFGRGFYGRWKIESRSAVLVPVLTYIQDI
eukprot:SAG11_NODE_889_length_6692_cov_6.292280_6_plen_69_part_00